MLRVSVMLGHLQFDWSWTLYTECSILSIQFTHDSKYMHEYRHAFSGSRLFWTVVEWLDNTHGQLLCWSYVVSLHTQRRDKQCWQGVWKRQYAKERILIWVLCIYSCQNTSTGVIDISSSPNYSDYVRERVYCRDLSVSSRSSFDFFVTSPIHVDIHQHDYFIFLGLKLKVIHRGRHTLFSQWYCGYVVYVLLV
jgi:hypothetical protein